MPRKNGAETDSTLERRNNLRVGGARTALINRVVISANDNAIAFQAAA